MAEISLTDFFNPFSKTFEQLSRDFKLLNAEQKIATVALTILCSLATCFLGGIAGYAVFCSLVAYFKTRIIKIIQDDPRDRGYIDDLYHQEVRIISKCNSIVKLSFPPVTPPIPIPGADTISYVKQKVFVQECKLESFLDTLDEEELMFPFSDVETDRSFPLSDIEDVDETKTWV